MEYLGRVIQEEETESTKTLRWRRAQAHHEVHHGWTERGAGGWRRF